MGLADSRPHREDPEDRPLPYDMLLRTCLQGAAPAAVQHFTIQFEEFDALILKVSTDCSALNRKRQLGNSVDPDKDFIHMELAIDLLRLYPELDDVRRECVPACMSEGHFWSNFFDAITVEVLRACLRRPTSSTYTHELLEALRKVSWDPRQLEP